MSSAIDVMRFCLNYYEFGYEKNLTIDRDNSLRTSKILEYNDVKFLKNTPDQKI